jgi:hypothetical protein
VIALLGFPSSIPPRIRLLREASPITATDLRGLHRECRTLVFRCGSDSAIRGEELAAVLRPPRPTVIAIVPAEELALRDVVACARELPELRAFLDDSKYDAELTDALSATRLSVEGRLLHAVAVGFRRTVWPVLAAAVLLARKRVEAIDLSRAMKGSDRTVRRRLASEGILPPAKLPAVFLGPFIASDVEIRGLSLCEAARYRGFAATDDLRRYLVSRSGRSPSRWVELGTTRAIAVAIEAAGLAKSATRVSNYPPMLASTVVAGAAPGS